MNGVLYTLDQIFPEQQIQEIVPWKFLLKIIMKENIFNVKLVKWPVAYSSHCKIKPNNTDFGPEKELSL